MTILTILPILSHRSLMPGILNAKELEPLVIFLTASGYWREFIAASPIEGRGRPAGFAAASSTAPLAAASGGAAGPA